MGFRVLLIAVKGKEPEAIHRDYGVVPTGEREEIPESPVTGAMLPSGAYLLYINDAIEPDDQVFARLSKDALLTSETGRRVKRGHSGYPRRDTGKGYAVR